jgi:hypothetical protein
MKYHFTKDDTVSIKLISGEELITSWQHYTEDAHQIQVKKPFVVVRDQTSIGLAPYILTSLDVSLVDINESSIVCITFPDPEWRNHYIQTTTGIVMA